MRIATNTMTDVLMYHQHASQSALNRSFQRLSSGLRLNSAKDDAAGMSISERMKVHIRSAKRMIQGTQDGLSMMQIADGALGQISELLLRGRELAMAANNDSIDSTQKGYLQTEMDALIAEIDRISVGAKFNGLNLISGGVGTTETETETSEEYVATNQAILDNLQRSFLQQSEKLISDYFGLSASGVPLRIILHEDIGGASAYVTGSPDNVELHIDVSEFENVGLDWPNDTLDQLIAHEMTHAVMLATTNLYSFEKWFAEGTAEFLPGGDARVDMLDGVLDGNTISADTIVNNIDSIRNAWGASQLDYSTAYIATRYLNDMASGGIKGTLSYLSSDPTRTLDDYFAAEKPGGIDNVDDFVASFKANGANYITNTLNLANTLDDVGAAGGGDADGGTRDASYSGTVPDADNPTANPLSGFDEIYPDPSELAVATPTSLAESARVGFLVGNNANDILEFSFKSVTSASLGISSINLVSKAGSALGRFDGALAALSQARSEVGAGMNRLEIAASVLDTEVLNMSAAQSRIADVDYAIETTEMAKHSIQQQALLAVMAQAQQIPRMMLQLL